MLLVKSSLRSVSGRTVTARGVGVAPDRSKPVRRRRGHPGMRRHREARRAWIGVRGIGDVNRRDVDRRRHPRSHLRRGHQRRVHLAHLRRPVRRQSPLRLRSHGPDPRLPLLRLSQEVLYVLHALLELRGAVGGIGRRGRRRASRGDGARAQARAGGAGWGSAPERGGRGADGAVALAEESLLRGAEVEAPGR